ncbi:MAG TPA: hypothetical protein VG937_18205 [Polyangiaceae bacterium]|nr:hypothetical protein [Polyangiaceae bacterium]
MPKPKSPAAAGSKKGTRRSASATKAKPSTAAAPKAGSWGWGGRRPGAGRPPGPEPRQALHRRRDDHEAQHPVLVTLRTGCRTLRSQAIFPTLRESIHRANSAEPERFRVVHFSVKVEKILLIVEARDVRALIEGVRGLSIRIARHLNPLLGLDGRFFTDRWRSSELTTPLAVRSALLEVLAGVEKQERAPLLPATTKLLANASKQHGKF